MPGYYFSASPPRRRRRLDFKTCPRRPFPPLLHMALRRHIAPSGLNQTTTPFATYQQYRHSLIHTIVHLPPGPQTRSRSMASLAGQSQDSSQRSVLRFMAFHFTRSETLC
ncbi:hypothetical protein BC567DRAFT_223185 [Phyllosticta citribraziliensis]